jgi:hypothetical protein
MIDSGAFILLKIRVSAEECPGQAEGRLTVLTKILGKSAAAGCLNHFLRDMTNLMKVCGFVMQFTFQCLELAQNAIEARVAK